MSPHCPTTLSVVVATYQRPDALDAVLRGLAAQSDPEFDVVVADDGSSTPTEVVVDRWKDVFGSRLSHVWQPDEGVRLARVRNLGAIAARGRYLIFVDGDCIPRRHFVAAIRRCALPGWFLAGTRLELGERVTRSVIGDGIPVERWSRPMLLLRLRRGAHGWRHLSPRDRRRPWRPQLADFWPHGNTYGFCLAVARTDFERVNGFDTRFVGWGEEDVDFATRVGRLGLRCGYAGSASTLLHLWHPALVPADRETWWLLQETIASERTEAVAGLREQASELPS